MLDPKILRENPEKIRKMLKERTVEFDLNGFIKLDEERRELIQSTDKIRKEKNDMSVEIARLKKDGIDATDLIEKMRKVSHELVGLENKQVQVETDYTKLAFTIPNLIHESVPIGNDESANKEIKKWGSIQEFDFKPLDHIELSEKLGLVDLERAAKTSGARFYYLTNDLVRLNQALINFALDFISQKNYHLIQPPYMINKSAMEGAIIAEDFKDVIYKIDDENLYLIGTSEHALATMHMNEILDGKKLPIRYAGISPCFRKEAGAHGKDQKGIFRVHQFDKVEQFVFARPEDSWEEHERMLLVAEEFYQKIGIPYRVMLLSSADIGKISAKTNDIEVWMAGQKAYREIVSCSNCMDFQSRRLKIRFRDKTNEQTQYVHTLNSTLVATQRTLVAIMENFQTKDGHISIPKVLKSYFGKDII